MQHGAFKMLQKAPFIERGFVDTISSQNKWWGVEKKKNTIDERRICIFRQTPNLLSRGSKCTFFFPLSLSLSSHLLIPNPIHEEWRWAKIVYFVKCDQFEARIHRVGVCVLPRSLFRSGVPVFKSPSLKWAHHKTNTVWQRAGSLCSYEAQNLMSMNNEYYSTCWWLSRLPVIRSMKALLSRERSLSRWIMDIRRSDIMERTFIHVFIYFAPQCCESADGDRHVAPHLTGNLFLLSDMYGMSAVNSLNLITVVF